ncbi:MAG TPA: transcription antitermination factor NusB [Actinomycetota bacterium]|nr:transcription antitermination factor NusB [Actinomycetota bacterium]
MPASARAVALDAIARVIDEGAYSNRLLPSLLAGSGLDRRDRAFAADLTYGTLRRLLPLDRVIAAAARRPLDRMTPGARHALRLGAYQLLDAGVAPHAAVQETVELVAAKERGFVNAVLRRIATAGWDPPTGTRDDDVAGRTGLAPWAVRELRRVVGDEAEAAAVAFATRAPLTLRTNACRTTPAELGRRLAQANVATVVGDVDPACLVVGSGGDPATFPGFGDGAFAIQDQASAFVARLVDARSGDRVLDVCAAPGGKAAALACAVRPDGAVVASDVAPARARLIGETASRLHERVTVLAADARAPAVTGGFDRVLVDAPCSGIGSARRRPELLWRVPSGALSQLARLQVAIVTASADVLRPGGRLVYSVCTFPRAETDAACDAIVRHRPDLVPVETDGPDGRGFRHRLWPHRHGTDGMFVAAFERVR